MGEAEDEFARAEALLVQLEAGETPTPRPIPVAEEDNEGLTEEDAAFLDSLEAVPAPTPKQETFRLGSYYLLHPAHMDNEVLANPDVDRTKPGQANGDILPYSVANGRIDAARFNDGRGNYVFKVLEKTEHTIKIQIGHPTRGLDYEGYLAVETGGRVPFIVTCKLDVFLRRIMIDKASPGFRRGMEFCSPPEAAKINTLYTQAIANAKKAAKAKAEKAKKAKASCSEKMEAIAAMAEEIYPGNTELVGREAFSVNSGMQENVSQHGLSNAKYLIIKFPEITISNTRKRKHQIKGLYVMVAVGERSGRFCMYGHVWGCRSEQTSMERQSGYRHSHLGSGSGRNMSTFCLGGGSSMAMATSELNSNFSLDKFELFLYQLSAYVRHESIEGGPYIKMENIRARSSSRRSINVQSEYDAYIALMTEKNIPLPVKLEKVGGKDKFVFDVNDPNYILLTGATTSAPHIRDVNGVLMPEVLEGINMSLSEKRSAEKDLFVFKGETVRFKVIDAQDTAVIQKTQKFPGPELSSFIKAELEKELNLYYILKESYELN